MNIKRILTATLFAVCVTFFFSCVSQPVQTVNVDEFEKQLITTKGEQLIDVRTLQEFEKYRIKSAKNIDFKTSDFRNKIEKLDKTKPLLIYCLSGVRSKAAAEVCKEIGFGVVYDLGGGINAWSKAGKPIDQDLSGKGELSSNDYNAIIATQGYVLVDFFAPWCAPCRRMLPMVQDLEKTYPNDFKLLTVDFDQNRLLAKEQKITSVPFLMIFKDGKKIWEKNSDATREELMEILNLK